MKGKILDFSFADSQGVISGDDGNRYTFIGKEWKSGSAPQAGARVDFEVQGRTSLAIYLDQPVVKSKGSHTNVDDSPLDGFYRSSDDKMLAGVCAGIAHKWNLSRAGLRFATLLLTIFLWIPLLIYVALWLVLPARPTDDVGSEIG